jgi:UDP-N-acetyl-D-glucosamine dehydrogenase
MVMPVELTKEEVAEADLVVVATDHDGFNWELVRNEAPLVLDTRRRLRANRRVELL